MVGVVSGNGLGVLTNSGAILGRDQTIGAGLYGTTGEKVVVNAKTGNLVIQGLDEFVPSNGNAGISVLRTYNSQGQLNDDNGDNWKLGLSRKLTFSGDITKSSPSSITVTRIDGDDSSAVYTYAGIVSGTSLSRYTTSDGAGGVDTITWNPGTNTWGFSDGASYEFENYDITGRLTVSRGLYYAYNGDGMLASVKDNTGGGTFFTYDSTNRNNLIGVVVSYPQVLVNGAPGPQTALRRVSYSYDAQNRLKEVRTDLTPQNGGVVDGDYYWTHYTYEGDSRRVATITQKDGGMLTIAYDNNRVRSVTDNMSETEIFTYVSATRTDVLNVQDNSVTSFEHDAAGQLISVTKTPASGPVEVNRYKYDARGNVIEITDADGDVTIKQYDANDNCIYERNPAGDVIKRTFDPLNRKSPLTETVYMSVSYINGVEEYPSSPATTRYIYDQSGENVRYVIGPENNVTEYRYNNFGQRTHAIQYTALKEALPAVALSGDYRKQLLDKMAAMTYPQRKNVVLSSYTFNPHGQIATATTFGQLNEDGSGTFDGTESTVQYTYDHGGNLLQQIDALGNQTSFVRDGLGRVLTAVAPATTGSATTKTVYDGTPIMRPVGGKDQMTTQSIVIYADAHRLVTTSDILGRVIRSEVQDAGGVTMSTTLYGYDSAGRLNMVQDPAGVKSYIFYDAAGRKGLTVDGDGSAVRYAYSAAGDLTRTTRYATAVDVEMFLSPTVKLAQLRAENLVVPSKQADRNEWRAYDKAGRLSRTVDHAGYVVEYRYDRASRLERTTAYANPIATGGGNSASLEVPLASADDRIKNIQHLLTGAVSGISDALGATNYERDQTGKQKGLWQNGAVNHETAYYNQKGQLSGEVDADGYLTEYAYDKNGNLTRKTRYATPGVANPSGGQTWTYDYVADKLTRETGPDGTVTVHVYDVMGARISSTVAYNTAEARTSAVRRDAMGRVIAELSADGAAMLSTSMTAQEVSATWNQYAVKYTYDGAGRRTSMTDQAGNRSVYYYDKDGRLAATINGEGDVEYREYTVLNELSKVTRFATQMSKSALPSMGGTLTEAIRSAIVSQANSARDLVRSYEHNNLGQVARETFGGSTDLFGYNAFGDLVSRFESIGNGSQAVSAMTYDVRGNLKTRVTSSYRSPALEENFSYDQLNRQVYRSIGGIVTTTGYDRRGNATLVDDGMTAGVQRQYDAFGRIKLETSALGLNTVHTYSTEERKVTITTPEGVVTTIVNNRHGERQSVTVGNTTTTYDYDRAGRLKKVNDGVGTAQQKHYDTSGRVDVITDGNGTETHVNYDAAGRVLTSIVDPAGLNLVTRYSYDGIGQVLSVTDPSGVVKQSEYDNRGNVIALTTDAAGLRLTTRFAYDHFGRTTKVIDANGSETALTYDEMGRRLSETVDSGSAKLTTSFTYDTAGNLSTRTDANNNVTRFYYDENNRLTNQVDATGGLTHYVYDGHNRVVQTRRYAIAIDLDKLPATGLKPTVADAVIGLALPDAARDNVLHNVYDKDGRLRFTVDGTGAVTERQYDGQNRVLKTVAYATHVGIEAAYGLEGVRDTVAQPYHQSPANVTTTMNYDARGRLIDSINGNGGVTHYDYDGNGQVTAITGYARWGGAVVSQQRMSYDGAGRLAYRAQALTIGQASGVTEWSIVHLGYDKAGNVVERTTYASPLKDAAPATGATSAQLANWMAGVTVAPARDQQERYVYDGANRQVLAAKAQGMEHGVLQWSVVAQTYDNAGNVVVRTAYADRRPAPAFGSNPSQQTVAQWLQPAAPVAGHDNITRMAYDGANRVRFIVDGMGAVTESRYDGVGNLQRRQQFNTTIAVSETPILMWVLASAMDDASDPADTAAVRVTEYKYDKANRLASIDDHRGLVEQRRYDGVGNMVMSVRGERIERFVYDADGQLRFKIDAGGYVTESVYDGAGRVANTVQYAAPLKDLGATMPSTSTEIVDRIDHKDANNRSTSYQYDAMGNVVASIDAFKVAERFEYDAMGRKIAFVNRLNNRWTYAYDAAGRLIRETSPQVLVTGDDGTDTLQSMVTQIGYDAFGNVTSRTEAAGLPGERTTRYEFDLAGHQVKTILPGVKVYDPSQEKFSITGIDRTETASPVEASTTVVYDGAGRAIRNIDAMGNLTQKIYNARGEVAFEIDALGNVTGYEHDAHGNVTRLTRYADSLAAAGAPTHVTELFLVLLGRAPNAGEISEWSAKFRAGATFAEIAMQLIVHPEADKFYPGGGDLRSFVAQVFDMAFGRHATDAEFNNWLALANAPGMTRGAFIETVLHNIEGAAELRAWNAKLDAVLPARTDLAQQVAVTQLYAALFNRSPTPAELAAGLRSLRQGSSSSGLANNMLNSLEGMVRHPANADGKTFFANLARTMLRNAPDESMDDLVAMAGKSMRAEAVVALIARIDSAQLNDPLSADRLRFAERIKANLGLAPVDATRTNGMNEASVRSALARADHARDRTIEMTYDHRNKLVTTLEGKELFYQRLGNPQDGTKTLAFEGRRLTTNRYNAFGDLIEIRTAASVAVDGNAGANLVEATPAAVTRFDYNQRGEKITEVVLADAVLEYGGPGDSDWHTPVHGAYVTRMEYDFAGNVIAITEYAAPISAEEWMIRSDWTVKRAPDLSAGVDDGNNDVGSESDTAAAADASAADWQEHVYRHLQSVSHPQDRITRYTYDLANRKASQLEVGIEVYGIFDPGSRKENVSTTYDYDAVGNLIETKNHLGGITHSNYDALGRVSSITGNAGLDEENLTIVGLGDNAVDREVRYTLTAFKRNIHGDVVRNIVYADGSTEAVAPQLRAVGDKDRVTITKFDRNGHAIEVTDADKKVSYASYDALGRLSRQWQSLTRLDSGLHPEGNLNPDGTRQGETRNTVFKIYRYDALGRVAEVLSPGTSTAVATSNPIRVTSVNDVKVTLLKAENGEIWNGTNAITLSYPPVPGSEIKVVVVTTNNSGSKQTERTVVGGSTGARISWEDKNSDDGGYGSMLSAVVSYRDANGNWKVAYTATREQLELKLVSDDGAATAVNIKHEETGYNSFGEVVQRSLDGVQYAYTQYDNVGRVWRTNDGDGIDKIMVYNVTGQATLQLRSAAIGAGSAADSAYRSIKEVNLASSAFERTETEYDLMGHTLLRYLPGSDRFSNSKPPHSTIVGSAIFRVVTGATTTWRQGDATWEGSNALNVTFNMPEDLGAGDVLIRVQYTNAKGENVSPGDENPGEATPSNEPPASTQTYQQVFDPSQLKVDKKGQWHATLNWDSKPGISGAKMDTVELFKKDLNGYWQLMAKVQDPAHNQEIAAPKKDLGPFMKVPALVNAVYSRDESRNYDLAVMHFGDTTLIDLSAIPPGTFTISTMLVQPAGVYRWREPYETSTVTVYGGSDVNKHVVISEAKFDFDFKTYDRMIVQASDRWGNVTYVSDPRDIDQATRYTYNARNQRIGEEVSRSILGKHDFKETTVFSSTQTYFDVLGRQVGTRDARDNVDAQAYDMQGNQAYQFDRTGVLTRSKFNLFGERIALMQPLTDEKQIVTNYSYDRLGRVEKSWIENVTTYRLSNEQDGIAEMTAVADGPDGKRTLIQSYRYDEQGRRISSKHSGGGETRTRYDLDGNVVATTDEMGVVMRYAYDGFHRKIFEQDAMGKRMSWEYATNGTLTSHTDLGERTVLYGYDGLRHMTWQKGQDKVGDPAKGGRDLSYTYDGAGMLTRIHDHALNQVTTYVYDEVGNRVRESSVVNKVVKTEGGAEFPQGEVALQIGSLYLAVLGRTGEMNAMWSWMNQITAKTMSLAEVAENVVGSVEAQARFPVGSDDAGFVDILYQSVLGRAADPAAREAHLAKLAGGAQRGEIVLDFIAGLDGAERDSFHAKVVAALNPPDLNEVMRPLVVQDNHTTYDNMNRITTVRDGRYKVVFAYDGNGNRVEVHTSYTNAKGEPVDTHAYNHYDALNRQTHVNGTNVGTAEEPDIQIGKYGHVLTYDFAGNRTSDTYAKDPNASELTMVKDIYDYDEAGRLATIKRDALVTDQRRYDIAGRLVRSGVLDSAPGDSAYIDALREQNMSINYRTMAYDAAGRIMRQKEYTSDGVPGTDIKYQLDTKYAKAPLVGYDLAGHLKGYYVIPAGSKEFNQLVYQTTYAYFDSYRQATLKVSSGGLDRTMTSRYDVNGHLIGVDAPEVKDQPQIARTFINDADGKVLHAVSGGEVTHALIVNGNMLGTTGNADAGNDPGIFASTYEPASTVAAANAPLVYIVKEANETLQSVAKTLWGDSKLWYLIADANGLSDETLPVGLALQVPARVNTVHNDYQTYKPYDPSSMVGDLTPTLPAPAANGGCGTVGMIVMMVVAVVVTILSAGAAAVAMELAAGGGIAGAWTAGLGVMVGQFGLSVPVVVAGAVGAAVGSIASQGVGVMMGMHDSINWNRVGASALGGAISAGVAGWATEFTVPLLSGTQSYNAAARAALGSALSQGVSSVTKMQDGFKWSNVAAAGIAAGASVEASKAIGNTFGTGQFGDIARSTASGIVATGMVRLFTGGNFNLQRVATDAFGNALGNSLVNAAASTNVDDSLWSRAGGSNPSGTGGDEVGLPTHEEIMKGDRYASLGGDPRRNWPSRAHGGTLAPNPGGADFPDGVLDADEVYVKQTYTGVNGEVIPVVQTDRGVYAYPGNAIPQVIISGKEALAALRAEDARAALADFNSEVQAHNDQMAADWSQSEGGWADSRQPDRIPLTNSYQQAANAKHVVDNLLSRDGWSAVGAVAKDALNHTGGMNGIGRNGQYGPRITSTPTQRSDALNTLLAVPGFFQKELEFLGVTSMVPRGANTIALDDVAMAQRARVLQNIKISRAGNAASNFEVHGTVSRLVDERLKLGLTSNASRQRNLALADYSVSGNQGTLVALSNTHSPAGTVAMPSERFFSTFSTPAHHNRALDSEMKIFETFARQHNPNGLAVVQDMRGQMSIFSELKICPSCNGGLRQFEEMFPNVAVNIRTGPNVSKPRFK